VILFSNKLSPRLVYIIDFVGKELFDTLIQITTNKEEFISSSLPRINYSEERLTEAEFWMQPHALLFEDGIHPQNINCFEYNGSKAFFKTEGDLPFDCFATSFYLLSRYEEYLPHQKDEFGRYAHQNSLAFHENFLELPLINLWLKEFGKLLNKKFPQLTVQRRPFSFLPTYDIDEAYSYKHKQWWRTAGGIIRSLFSGQFSKMKERVKVLQGKKKDPYDCYDWMDSLHEKYQLNPCYFFHLGLKNSKYDKNILPSSQAMKKLIRQHAERYMIGIHPSWKSNDSPDLLKYEILNLGHIAGKQALASRQHFIKFNLPETYHGLIENDIQKDFSMGYGNINGFRASVASPFYWYDLEKETATDLMIYPFCFMDANSFFEQKQTAEQAFEEMISYYEVIKSVNGTMITIWHNSFLGTAELFTGWRDAYEKFIKHIKAGI
jgi:hypothetical protein